MNNNQYNRNRMVTRSRVQPGHLFVAIESKHKQSKPKQSKQGTQLRESSNDSLSGSYSEQILLLETLWLEALKVNLTTTAAIEKMREYIRDGPPPPLDYYIDMWTERLSQLVDTPFGKGHTTGLSHFGSKVVTLDWGRTGGAVVYMPDI
jgi:hypothetical protein